MPAESEKQRRFMGAELARKRAGKATRTEMTEDQLEDFASKQFQKLNVGARQEGPRPQFVQRLQDHELPRKKGHGSEYPPNRNGALGPHRELKKEQKYLRYQVRYKLATPAQMDRGERCDTCIHWKNGAACDIVLGYIYPEAICDHWEKNDLLQGEHAVGHLQKAVALKPVKEPDQKQTSVFDKLKQHPSIHSHQDDHPTHLHVQVHKEDGGGGDGGGALAGGGTVFTSTNSGIFNPTHGGDGKKKKKKSGIERLGQFITENSPEKKMVKSSVTALTEMIHEVRMELRKDDKRQTPPNSKPTPDDPPQAVEREADIPDDPNLVADQKMTEKEQKRIMNEDKHKDSSDPHTLLMAQDEKAWGSGGHTIDPYSSGGDKDELEEDEDRNEPEKPKFIERLRKWSSEDDDDFDMEKYLQEEIDKKDVDWDGSYLDEGR